MQYNLISIIYFYNSLIITFHFQLIYILYFFNTFKTRGQDNQIQDKKKYKIY